MRRFRGATLILLLVGGGWLLTTNHVQVFPVRNTLQYYLLHQWWQVMGYPESNGTGVLSGILKDEATQPIANAVVLATRWDGTAFHTRTDSGGNYRLQEVPEGYYAVVAGKQGYLPQILDTLNIRANDPITLPSTLEAIAPRVAGLLTTPAVPLWAGTQEAGVSALTELSCDKPVPATAHRRTFTIRPDQAPAYPFYLYTPLTATESTQLPVLLTLYPGPAEGWDCVSLPLAQAGYAVISFGTQHRLDLEEDVTLLKELVELYLREGAIPNTDPTRMVVLGGSYSAFHAQRLLQDEPDFRAGILLGAPTDLFDMRRRFEQEGFIPPYGLDQAFRALGFPDREPLRYWQYSAAYHVHAAMPPLLLVHSRADEIVPYPQSTLLAEQLEAVGVPYELHFFEGASHYLLEGDSDALQIYELTLRFLREHL
jgi:pimeloyl-ACP methyl ester carboxylesterase